MAMAERPVCMGKPLTLSLKNHASYGVIRSAARE